MRAIPLILALLLAGCSPRELPSVRLHRQILEWVPPGTPLISAQHILEQHQFSCWVTSYTNKQGMIKDGAEDQDAHWWNTTFRENGQSVAVTNLTHLGFKKTNVWGVLTYINGKYAGGIRVMVFGE